MEGLGTILPSFEALKPRLVIVDDLGHPCVTYYLADHMQACVTEGQQVNAGDILGVLPWKELDGEDLAVQPWEYNGSDLVYNPRSRMHDYLSGGPTEDSAVLATADGVVESIRSNNDHATVVLLSPSNQLVEVNVPHSQMVCVGIGYRVTESDRLTYKLPINPGDMFRICGLIAGSQNLLGRIHCIFKKSGISLDSKNIELAIRRMLSLVEIDSTVDTDFVKGELVDRSELKQENDRVSQTVCITKCEIPEFTIGQLVRRDSYETYVVESAPENKTPPKVRPAIQATAKIRLTSIEHFAGSRKRSQSFGGLSTIESLADHAMTEDVQPITRLADLAVLQLANLPDEDDASDTVMTQDGENGGDFSSELSIDDL